MRSVEEALAAILSDVRLTAEERLPVDRCLGRVPAALELVAAVDVPAFDNSAMDGYALRAADAPGSLPLAGEVAAGAGQPAALEPGHAVRIMTGAPVPAGADAIVPIEDAEEEGGRVTVPAVEAGRYVRAAGHDTRRGDRVTLEAAPLTPGAIGLLVSLGLGEVAVRARPRVAIVSTGDELVAAGQPLAAAQVHDANGPALAAAVVEAGGAPFPPLRIGDDEAAVDEALRSAAVEADLVITSGGVSVGRYDHVRTAIERLGRLDLWRIAVQPGKPLAVGHIGPTPVLGLPGNPVSALVTFELFARPLLRTMLGLAGSGRQTVPAICAERIGKDRVRRAYLRVVVKRDGTTYLARPAGGQSSSQLRPLAAANALLVVPEGVEAAEAGETYDALLLGDVA